MPVTYSWPKLGNDSGLFRYVAFFPPDKYRTAMRQRGGKNVDAWITSKKVIIQSSTTSNDWRREWDGTSYYFFNYTCVMQRETNLKVNSVNSISMFAVRSYQRDLLIGHWEIVRLPPHNFFLNEKNSGRINCHLFFFTFNLVKQLNNERNERSETRYQGKT